MCGREIFFFLEEDVSNLKYDENIELLVFRFLFKFKVCVGV